MCVVPEGGFTVSAYYLWAHYGQDLLPNTLSNFIFSLMRTSEGKERDKERTLLSPVNCLSGMLNGKDYEDFRTERIWGTL